MKVEKKIRIGMVLDDRFPPDARVEKEISILVSNGFEVYLLCYTFGDDPPVSEFKGARIIRIQTNRKVSRKLRALINTIFDIYTIYWKKKIINFVKKYKIDMIHIHDLYLVGAGLKAKDQLQGKVKIIGDLHENYADALQYYKFSNTFPGNILISVKKWKKKEKEWISKLDRAVVVIEEMKKRISDYLDEDKIAICENCPEIESFQNDDVSEEIHKKYKGSFVISYIGAFDWHRGIDTVLQAVSELSEIKELKLCIVGTGKIENELKSLANKLQIEDKVIFEGWKSPALIPNYFKLSDIGIIPHLKSVQTDNSSPNKLYQYMYYQTPIISTNCQSLERILKETETGLVYESGDIQGLAEKVRQLYKNKELRDEMAERGKQAIEDKYNWGFCSKELISMYKEMREKK